MPILYEHVEIWVWTLAALVAGMAGVVMWLLWDRDTIAAERDAALGYIRELGRRRARARTPAKTRVLPAFLHEDPEEFRRTRAR